MHVAHASLPDVALNVPASHGRHDGLDVSTHVPLRYRPAPQLFVHSAQLRSVMLVGAAVWKLPDWQTVHIVQI